MKSLSTKESPNSPRNLFSRWFRAQFGPLRRGLPIKIPKGIERYQGS